MSKQPIRVTVWNEFVHEREHESVAKIYPDGIHGAIRDALVQHLGDQITVRKRIRHNRLLFVERLEDRHLLTVNLEPFAAFGGDDSVVVAHVTGTTIDDLAISVLDTVYVDVGWRNDGAMATGTGFTNTLVLDDGIS